MIKNKGFGVIELMISILVASLIVVGLYSLLTSSILSYGFSRATNQAVSSAHRVNMSFNTILYQASFINYRRALLGFNFSAAESVFPGGNWQENVSVLGGNLNGQDFVKVRFAGASVADDRIVAAANDNNVANGFIYDCLGMPIPNTVILEVMLTVDPQNGLVCQEHALENSNGVAINQNQVVLDPSVRFMRIQYASVGDKGNTNGYVDAGDVATNTNWADINVLRYALVVSHASNQRIVSARNDVEFTLFPNDANIYKPTDNEEERSNIHRVVSGNVALVNKFENRT